MSDITAMSIYKNDFVIGPRQTLLPIIYKQTPSLQIRKNAALNFRKYDERPEERKENHVYRNQITPNPRIYSQTKHLKKQRSFEKNADMFRFNELRTENTIRPWQGVKLLDRIQSRYPVERLNCCDKRVSYQKRSPRKYTKEESAEVSNRLAQKISVDELSLAYSLPFPGYGGFLPRVPPTNFRKKEHDSIKSTMRAEYRLIPCHEYFDQSNLKTGVFSKTVTLTYPYNPFNKISNTKLNELE